MTVVIIGIDPGSGGGIAVVRAGEAYAFKMPETEHDLCQELRMVKQSNGGAPLICYLEKVHSSPQMGVKSAFTFGQGFGSLLGALAALGIRRELVSPQKWQGAMNCRTGGDKNITKRRAQELFPDLKITHAIADALLIAEYGLRIEKGIAK